MTDDEYACPTCEETFDSEKGRNLHHYFKHGESLVTETAECQHCGSEFEYYTGDSNGQFCSRKCLRATEIGRHESECDFCGDTFEYYPSSEPGRYCSYSCKARDKTGEENPFWNGGPVTLECVICGAEFETERSTQDSRETCSTECMGIKRAGHWTGPKNPRWSGGAEGHYYGPTWERLRDTFREDRCQMPGCERTETRYGSALHVHHIIPVREFDDPEDAHYSENLVTLCHEHHMAVEQHGLDVPLEAFAW